MAASRRRLHSPKRKPSAICVRDFADADLAVIGAAPDGEGAFGFEFQSGAMQRPANPRRWINWAIICAAAVFLSLSVDVHLSRRQQALEQYEAEILSALKDMRPARALFDGADAANFKRCARPLVTGNDGAHANSARRIAGAKPR